MDVLCKKKVGKESLVQQAIDALRRYHDARDAGLVGGGRTAAA
ncbi:hypothetical protein [Pseudomonas putida]